MSIWKAENVMIGTARDGYTKSGYILHIVLSAAAGIGIILAILFTVMQYVCYHDFDMYREEYEKYDVLSDLPEGVTMSDEDGLMAVTKHMMKYLIGDKDTPDLQIQIRTKDGMRDFFSERELLHMADCKVLFRKALQLRYLSVMFAIFVFIYGRYAIIREPKAFRKATGTGLLIGAGIFFAGCLVIGIYMALNFSSAFITFHHIFFDNDLWLLDPRDSLLINILPEGFFFDVFRKILVRFLPAAALFVLGAFLLWKKNRNVRLTFREF